MPDGTKRIRIWGFYLLGVHIERLGALLVSNGPRTEVISVLRELEPFRDAASLEDIGIEATYWINLLVPQPNTTLSPPDCVLLRDSLVRWETKIAERVQQFFILQPDATVLRPERLAKGIQGVLPPEDFAALEPIEVSDLQEACFCILVGAATAGEAMALRAAESLLRRWYKNQPSPKTLKDWGKILDELEVIYPPGPMRPKVLALLDYLRQRRNEVNHPDRISWLPDAETTLMNVTQLLSAVRPYLLKTPPPATPLAKDSNAT